MAFAMEVLGERWAMLIVRELMLGPRRFSDLRASLPGISAKVLTERLEGLAEWGVLERRTLPPPAAAQVYELTEWGYSADSAINALGRWAAQSCRHDGSLPLSSVSLMASMRTMQLPEELASSPDMVVGVAIGNETFRCEVSGGRFANARGPLDGCDVVLRADDARPIARALYAGMPLSALEENLGLAVEGNRDMAGRFVTLFALPSKLDAE